MTSKISMSTKVYYEPYPENMDEATQRHNKALADLNAPIDLGRAVNVAYDNKSDRYAVTFLPGNDKKLVLKATSEVVGFVSEHINEAGYWRGRMDNAVLVDAHLVQP